MNLWNLRQLGEMKFLRKFVKFSFSFLFYNGRIIHIKRGPLKDLKWVCHKDAQFWMPLGLYENETSRWLKEQLSGGRTFIDIGANFGYFTLLGSRMVGNNGQVLAFEPVPINVKCIESHINVNHIANVVLEDMVISDSIGIVSFTVENNNANSHLTDVHISHAKSNSRRLIDIKSITLDSYLNEKNIHPDVIKIDVEGAEIKVLQGAYETLRNDKPVCIVSIHSKECYDGCMEILNKLDYKVKSLKGFDHELCCYPS